MSNALLKCTEMPSYFSTPPAVLFWLELTSEVSSFDKLSSSFGKKTLTRYCTTKRPCCVGFFLVIITTWDRRLRYETFVASLGHLGYGTVVVFGTGNLIACYMSDRFCYEGFWLPLLCGTFVASVGCLRYMRPLSPKLVASAMWDLCRLNWLPPLHETLSPQFVTSAMGP